EITNLMIPGENDDPDETRRLCDWVVAHLGESVPIHFTAFHPDFKLTDRPRTPAATLARAREIARSAGIQFAYVGNVHDREGQTTYCPSCAAAVIRRSWHEILENHLRAGRRKSAPGAARSAVCNASFPGENAGIMFYRKRAAAPPPWPRKKLSRISISSR